MTNVTVRGITYQKALSNAAFSSGFDDVAKGNGWNERWDRVEQWNYERGRMFAAWLASKGQNPKDFPLKSGRWASNQTIASYRIAQSEGAVF